MTFTRLARKPIPATTESPKDEASGGLPDDFAGSLTNFARTVLSLRQQSAIQILVSGETDTAVAHKLGIDRTTIWRWKRHRHFRAVLDEARELVFGVAIDRLRDLAPRAVDIFQKDLEISGDPPVGDPPPPLDPRQSHETIRSFPKYRAVVLVIFRCKAAYATRPL